MKNFLVIFSAIGRGGAERMVSDLIGYLAIKNYQITIISLGKPADYSVLNFPANVEILHFTRAGKFDFSSFNEIGEIIKQRELPFVFCIDFFAQLYMSLLRKSQRIFFNIVVNLHITKPVVKKDYLINFWAGSLLKATDSVIFICKNQQRYIENRFLLFSKVKKKLIYNGIDTDIYKIPAAEQRALLRKTLLNVAETTPVIIKVAGIRLEKDHETAIRALNYLINKYSINPKLVFAGDGDKKLTAHLKQLTTELGLSDNIVFTGFTTKVKDYLACADVFTLTSANVETFSLAALEAMACGLPAVITNIGGADEMVTAGRNGELAQPKNHKDIGNKWYKTITKSYPALEIRTTVVENFTLLLMTEQYHHLFEGMYSIR